MPVKIMPLICGEFGVNGREYRRGLQTAVVTEAAIAATLIALFTGRFFAKGLIYLSLVYLATEAVAVAAEQANVPGGKEPVIRATRPDDGRRDGITIIADEITDDPWHVEPGKKVHVSATLIGLTAEQLKGKLLAFQFAKGGPHDKVHVQKKVVWVTASAAQVRSGRFVIATDYTFSEIGDWNVNIGLVDPIKFEWWLRGGGICTVGGRPDQSHRRGLSVEVEYGDGSRSGSGNVP